MVGRESQPFLAAALQDRILAPNSRVSRINSFANSDVLFIKLRASFITYPIFVR
jgi:hypothetical protein